MCEVGAGMAAVEPAAGVFRSESFTDVRPASHQIITETNGLKSSRSVVTFVPYNHTVSFL